MTSLTESEQEPICPWLSQITPYKPLGTCPDFEHLKQHMARNYALMAMNPATIDHARFMVKKYEKEIPELAGLGILTAEKLKQFKEKQE
jgi:hypothetical protein